MCAVLLTCCVVDVQEGADGAGEDVGVLEQQLTLANTWTSCNNNMCPYNQPNRWCQVFGLYMQQFPSQWTCTCTDLGLPSCRNGTTTFTCRNCKVTNGPNGSYIMHGYVMVGSPWGPQYHAEISAAWGDQWATLYALKPERTPSVVPTGEQFVAHSPLGKLERWVP